MEEPQDLLGEFINDLPVLLAPASELFEFDWINNTAELASSSPPTRT